MHTHARTRARAITLPPAARSCAQVCTRTEGEAALEAAASHMYAKVEALLVKKARGDPQLAGLTPEAFLGVVQQTARANTEPVVGGWGGDGWVGGWVGRRDSS